MAQVVGSIKNDTGVLKETFKIIGIHDDEAHNVLLHAMDMQREANVWEVTYDEEPKKRPVPGSGD